MGWESRDWAKWTDEERNRYLGSTATVAVATVDAPASHRNHLVLLAALLTAVASVAAWHFHVGSPPPSLQRYVPAPSPLVYGTGLAHLQGSEQEMTCTAMSNAPSGTQLCTTWTYLAPGQRAAQAAPLPAGTPCPAVTADQHTGRWMCGSSNQ